MLSRPPRTRIVVSNRFTSVFLLKDSSCSTQLFASVNSVEGVMHSTTHIVTVLMCFWDVIMRCVLCNIKKKKIEK